MKNKYIAGVLAVVTLLSTSCHKFLDQQPRSTASDQTTWQSDGDANASVAACYALIRAAFNASTTYYAYGDLPSDEIGSIVGNDFNFTDVMNMNWGISIPGANTGDVRLKLRLYTNFYTAIAQSNRCIHFINDMPLSDFTGDDTTAQRARKNHYLGEAYFTRAFNYFYISRVWGDVPLITDYIADASTAPQLPRSPQQTVLNQCIADLNIAKQYLDWQDPTSTDRVVRADKGAVFALLAHIYAWRGDYDNCNMACDSVINSQIYGLVDGADYPTIYKGQSTESIFEISQNLQSESIAVWNSVSGVTLAPPYIVSTNQPAWQISTGVFQTLFSDTNDLRLQKVFTTLSTGSVNAIECIKYASIYNVNGNTAFQVAENNIIVFRLADIELLKAEALAAKPAPDYAGSLDLVNAIRTRAGLSTPLTGIVGNALLDTVTAERGRELFFEGQRYYDLVRQTRNTGTNQFPNISSTEFAAGKYYWPVDPTLFLTNAKLTQTPFWQGKVR